MAHAGGVKKVEGELETALRCLHRLASMEDGCDGLVLEMRPDGRTELWFSKNGLQTMKPQRRFVVEHSGEVNELERELRS